MILLYWIFLPQNYLKQKQFQLHILYLVKHYKYGIDHVSIEVLKKNKIKIESQNPTNQNEYLRL